MIVNINTIFNLVDNSGIKKLKNINILNKDKKIKINNISVSVVKKGSNIKTRIKKSDIVNALIVSTKCYNFYKNKNTIFSDNSTVLFKQDKICFTKIKGLISSVVRNKFYKSKINVKKAKFI
ncbi:ribosomal protein L14 (apicoplast) [Theileria orientalis]|uniref:Ribosomal protein L14 n=1 Tax=Theileria orientalis TaxID=68886 RepID=A0A976XJM0_THEOR|nr:ribosomal protein L14 [Theileria orientalis]